MEKIIELIAGNSFVSIIAAASISLVTITWVVIFVTAFFQGRRISLGPIQIEEKQKLNSTESKIGQLKSSNKELKLLPNKWVGNWEYQDRKVKGAQQERLFITEQHPVIEGLKLKGYITVDAEPEKKWNFEGNFSGKFIQLYYYPSDEADDGLFLDYGCYFFEIKNDGHFEGYSIGCEWDDEILSVAKHVLRKV